MSGVPERTHFCEQAGATGVIDADFQKGLIKAEGVSGHGLVAVGSIAAASLSWTS